MEVSQNRPKGCNAGRAASYMCPIQRHTGPVTALSWYGVQHCVCAVVTVGHDDAVLGDSCNLYCEADAS